MQITRRDLAPFRAEMEPAYKRSAAYAGEDNVKKFRTMVEAAHGVASGCVRLQYPNRLAIEKRQGVLDALPVILAVYLDYRVAQMRREYRVRRAR